MINENKATFLLPIRLERIPPKAQEIPPTAMIIPVHKEIEISDPDFSINHESAIGVKAQKVYNSHICPK